MILKVTTTTENATSASIIITTGALGSTLVRAGFDQGWIAKPFSSSKRGNLIGRVKI